MATQDNGSGLLSKVAKFVLNPTVDWVDIDKPGEARAADRGKEALKQMIERKQYNDAVRRREFDKLRKLRRNAVPMVAGVTAPASSFQDSWGYSVFEERANTLKKIDEIEAQMSKQWWKGREPSVPGGLMGREVAAQAAQPPGALGLDSAFATTMPADLADRQEKSRAQPCPEVGLTADSAAATAKPDASESAQTVTGAFSVSVFSDNDADQALPDPRLEEAAIRFANSDDGGAESVLLGALQTPGAAAELSQTWVSALLDLYRATGQRASFEHMAADYAFRFECAAPVWGGALQDAGQVMAQTDLPTPEAGAGQMRWYCPATLDAAAVLQLQDVVQGSSESTWLDWRSIKTMTPQAAQTLAALVAHWCEQPLRLYLEGVEALEHLLRLHTPMGDSQVEQFWWRLRLDWARILRLQDDFELVALDFCVTFEMSPPSWQPARCQRLDAATLNAVATSAGLTDPPMLSVLPPMDTANGQPLALRGEVLGDASAVLQSLQAAMSGNRKLVVSCTELVRVDFSAAGSILNWMANAQAQGARIELRDVPQLVAVFFHLIGINEHARIIIRNN